MFLFINHSSSLLFISFVLILIVFSQSIMSTWIFTQVWARGRTTWSSSRTRSAPRPLSSTPSVLPRSFPFFFLSLYLFFFFFYSYPLILNPVSFGAVLIFFVPLFPSPIRSFSSLSLFTFFLFFSPSRLISLL